MSCCYLTGGNDTFRPLSSHLQSLESSSILLCSINYQRSNRKKKIAKEFDVRFKIKLKTYKKLFNLFIPSRLFIDTKVIGVN